MKNRLLLMMPICASVLLMAVAACDSPRQVESEPLLGRLKLDSIYRVPIEHSATVGAPNAELTLVVFYDFECPFSKDLFPTLEKLKEHYPDKLRLVFKSFPLPFHQHSVLASEAALAAHEQGLFWQYYRVLYGQKGRDLDRRSLENYARQIKLDLKSFKNALNTRKHHAVVQKELAQGRKLGVRITPVSFLNGHPIVGSAPLDFFIHFADREIVKAKELLDEGVAPEDLYDTIIKDGLTQPVVDEEASPLVGHDDHDHQPTQTREVYHEMPAP